jgi:hypothetical protein
MLVAGDSSGGGTMDAGVDPFAERCVLVSIHRPRGQAHLLVCSPFEVHAHSPTRASAADQHSRQLGHSHSVSVTRVRVSCRPQSVVISLPEGRCRLWIPAAWR